MSDIFDFAGPQYGRSDPDYSLKMVGPKLHGIRVTECQLDYHGSITIDAAILEQAGLYPMEYVNIWNKNSGNRISTYLLPGERGSGVCCLNGAAARTCQKGDELIIASERSFVPGRVLNYTTPVLIFRGDNSIAEILQYNLELGENGVRFFVSARIDNEPDRT